MDIASMHDLPKYTVIFSADSACNLIDSRPQKDEPSKVHPLSPLFSDCKPEKKINVVIDSFDSILTEQILGTPNASLTAPICTQNHSYTVYESHKNHRLYHHAGSIDQLQQILQTLADYQQEKHELERIHIFFGIDDTWFTLFDKMLSQGLIDTVLVCKYINVFSIDEQILDTISEPFKDARFFRILHSSVYGTTKIKFLRRAFRLVNKTVPRVTSTSAIVTAVATTQTAPAKSGEQEDVINEQTAASQSSTNSPDTNIYEFEFIAQVTKGSQL